MNIGNCISELRKQNNFSQEYIAEKLDVSRQAVSKWEQNKTNPDTENLIKFAELFGVPTEYLATGKKGQTDLNDSFSKRPIRLGKKTYNFYFCRNFSLRGCRLCSIYSYASR